jgi:hypothetical protein
MSSSVTKNLARAMQGLRNGVRSTSLTTSNVPSVARLCIRSIQALELYLRVQDSIVRIIDELYTPVDK